MLIRKQNNNMRNWSQYMGLFKGGDIKSKDPPIDRAETMANLLF